MTGELVWFGVGGKPMMHVDGAAPEFGGLEGGDLPIGSSFVVEVVRADEQRLTATVRLVNGRLECRELHLRTEHGQIDDRALHQLGLATILQQAATHIAGRLGEPRSD
jgi:hypothetical protein